MAEQFVKSVYNHNELYHYIFHLEEFVRKYGNILHSNNGIHKLQLFAVIVTTSAPSTIIKFDLKVKMIDEISHLEVHCGKYNTTIKIDPFFSGNMVEFINYTTYRSLESSLKLPYQVVEKKFFIYTSDEYLYDEAIEIGLQHYGFYEHDDWFVLDLMPEDEMDKIQIPSLQRMTDIMSDLFAKCKSLPEISDDDLLDLETIYETHKTADNYRTWADHRDSLVSMTMFMAIMAQYTQ
jgi:hypothetical protein